MNLALFDLDGTLLDGDSDHAFCQFVVALGWADAQAFARRNDAFFADYLAGRLDVHAYVEFATAPWRQRSPAELAQASQRFMAEVVRPMLKPAAQALVDRHRGQGDRLALVTATNDFVTRPIAQVLGIDTLIATNLERDAQGSHGRDRRRALVPRRQGHPGRELAGCRRADAGELSAQQFLQRFHERPAAARTRQPPRGHQSRPCAREPCGTARLAHPEALST
jgi:HAD superfamily phosphoserine phosphatase-like hydrolase